MNKDKLKLGTNGTTSVNGTTGTGCREQVAMRRTGRHSQEVTSQRTGRWWHASVICRKIDQISSLRAPSVGARCQTPERGGSSAGLSECGDSNLRVFSAATQEAVRSWATPTDARSSATPAVAAVEILPCSATMCECAHSFAQRFCNSKNVCGARVMTMRCCGTKWSVLYSVLMLGSMGRLRATLVLFLVDPRQPQKKRPCGTGASTRCSLT